MRSIHFAILLILLAACGGQPRDTCTQGVNMTAPHIVGDLDVHVPEPTMRIEWDPGTGQGASLPDAYFEQAEVVFDDVVGVGAEASYQAPRSLTLTFHGLSDRTIAGKVIFPDRAAYIECSHPGMADEYTLEFVLHFAGDGRFVDASFHQSISLGDI